MKDIKKMKNDNQIKHVSLCPVEWARISSEISTALIAHGISQRYISRAIDMAAAILAEQGDVSDPRDGVSLPRNFFDAIFRNKEFSARIKYALESSAILIPDGSWCSGNNGFGDYVKCQKYFIPYTPQTPQSEWISVSYPSDYTRLDMAIRTLDRLPPVDLDHKHFDQILIDKESIKNDVAANIISVDDLCQFVALAKKYGTLEKVKSNRKADPRDKREYTLLSCCNKKMYKYLLSAKTGKPVREAYDFTSAFLLEIMVHFCYKFPRKFSAGNMNSSAIGDLGEIFELFYHDHFRDPSRDLYRAIIRHIEEKSPSSNLFFGMTPAEKRDYIKRFVLSTLYSSESDRKRWHTLALRAKQEMLGKIQVSLQLLKLEREARIHIAIIDFFNKKLPKFWQTVVNYDTEVANGKKRAKKIPLYHALTEAERMLTALASGCIRKITHRSDLALYRKHDALLTCEEIDLTPAQKDAVTKMVFEKLQEFGVSNCMEKCAHGFND